LLDGSPFAERALPVARWVAASAGAAIHLVEVVATDEDAEDATRYLDSVGYRGHTTSWEVRRGDDVAAELAEVVAGEPGTAEEATSKGDL
jgi:nucleotide-binding universal stress UspA family protein